MSDPQRQNFESRMAGAFAQLAPAEQRLVQYISTQKERVVLGSAAQIAAQAGVSDATVIRTARALGYEGLGPLREDILRDLTGAQSPANLLAHTLNEIGSDPARVLAHVVGLHEGVLEVLTRPDFASAFNRAIDLIAAARTRHVFGIGPSGALADYAALQFNRIGMRTMAMTASGIGLAEHMLWIEPGDAVVMLAYAPLYREVRLVLDRAEELHVPVVLISDSLGPHVSERVAEILPVARGRADHLAMHGGTMVALEALVLGLAAKSPDQALTALDNLSVMRGALDSEWRKRGTRKP
ncbi:MAG: MurR/RpiR family transcriptional regulator [Devosia sp.]